MRTIRIKLYKFNELSESAKQKAIENYLYSTNDSFAWDNTKEDAEQVNLIISSLSDHKANSGEFKESALNTANMIIVNHGEMCETYKTAKEFIDNYTELVKKFSDGIDIDKVEEGNEYDFDNDADDLEQEFLKSILEDYRIMYNNEIEYENSNEYVIEQFEANDYEFTQDGKLS